MPNRAQKIAGPIIRKFDGSVKSANETDAAVRAALAAHRYPDGREVHPCVIDEWAHEPYRRILMRVAKPWHHGNSPVRLERRLRQRNIALTKRQRASRKINRLVKKIGTVAQRIFRRHMRRAHDRSK